MRGYNKNAAIYEEYGLKQVMEWICEFGGGNFNFAELNFADLKNADLNYAELNGAELNGADFDFSVLSLSCRGIGINFDERTIKQLFNHALKQNNDCEVYKKIQKIFLDDKELLDWLESWHRKDEVKHLEYYFKGVL